MPTQLQVKRSRPRVSVIIPVYQSARTLGSTITGALNQTYENTEIVVCIDGATDESRAIARAYGRMVTIVEQDNQGLSAARNAAIEAATGELVTLCDSDDVLLPSHIEKAVDAWVNAGAGRQFVSSNAHMLGREGLTDVILTRPPGSLRHQRMAMLEGNIATIFSTFPKSMWEELGGFATDLRAMEDYDLWLRAVMAGWELHHVMAPTAVYRLTLGSMSSDTERMDEANRAVRTRLRDSGVSLTRDERDLLDASLRLPWVGHSIEKAARALEAGRSAEAAAFLRDAARVSPSDRKLRLKAELLTRAAPVASGVYRWREGKREARRAR